MCLQVWAHIATIFSGILTPILTGFTIRYLYLAFTKQTEANNLIRESQTKQTEANKIISESLNKQAQANKINNDSLLKVSFESNYDRIYKLILEFENNLKPTYSNLNQSKIVSIHKSEIEHFIDSLRGSNDHENFLRSYHFNNLYFILTQFDYTLDFIESSNLNKNLKEYCLKNLTILYYNKLNTPITRLNELYASDKMYFETQELRKTDSPKKQIEIMLEIHAKFNKLVNNHEL